MRRRKVPASPFAGLPIEKRVTAYLVSSVKLPVSFSSVFEEFLVEYQKAPEREVGPRLRNAILVNQRNEELSISAGGSVDGVYIFTHSNRLKNSVFIVVYLGPSRDIAYGKELLVKFKDFLGSRKYQIKDYLVTSSEDEAVEEALTENATYSYADRTELLQTSTAAILGLACAGE